MSKDVMLVTGAGQISMALARRIGFGKKIVLGDKNPKNCETIAKIMNDAGYDVEPFVMDISSRESICAMIKKGQEFGMAVSVIMTPESIWGYERLSSAYNEDPSESWMRIYNHMKERWPADDSAIIRLIGRKPED